MARANSESYAENFDGGTRGNFDSQTNSGSSLITFPHYSELARFGMAPWSGDYVMKCTLSGSATSFLTETGGFDVVDAGETWHFWFPILVQEDFTLTAGDLCQVFQLSSGAAQVDFGIRNNSGTYEFYIGQSAATNTRAFTRNNRRWYQMEFTYAPAAGTGTIDWYVDGGQVGAQIGSLTNTDLTQGLLGILTEAETLNSTSGSFLIDSLFMTSDARIYPRRRFDTSKYVVDDGVVFVGPCVVDSIHFTSTVDDDVCIVTDTDDSNTANPGSRDPEMILRVATANDVAPGFSTPVRFERGVHLAFTGTGIFEAVVNVNGGAPVSSHANYVDRGLRRKNKWAA